MNGRSGIDFEGEGLLEGLDGSEREARLALLRELEADGVGIEELREAVQQNRLALLPVERVLSGEGPCYTPRQVAELSGVELDLLQDLFRAMGLPRVDPDETGLDEHDLTSARRLRTIREAGIADRGHRRHVAGDGDGDGEHRRGHPGGPRPDPDPPRGRRAGRRAALRDVGAGPRPRGRRGDPVRPQPPAPRPDPPRRDGRRWRLRRRSRAAPRSASASPTWSASPSSASGSRARSWGVVAGRLGELAREAAETPVRLMKMIGDAAMLVSPDADALLDAASRWWGRRRRGRGLPPAAGRGRRRRGDRPRRATGTGDPVNLASRITDDRPPGQRAGQRVGDRDGRGDGYRWSFAGERRLKGIDGGRAVPRPYAGRGGAGARRRSPSVPAPYTASSSSR